MLFGRNVPYMMLLKACFLSIGNPRWSTVMLSVSQHDNPSPTRGHPLSPTYRLPQLRSVSPVPNMQIMPSLYPTQGFAVLSSMGWVVGAVTSAQCANYVLTITYLGICCAELYELGCGSCYQCPMWKLCPHYTPPRDLLS